MNEWLTAVWNRVRRSIDQAVIVALLVLLGVVFFFYWLEQQIPEPAVPTPPPVAVSPTPLMWTSFTLNFDQPKKLRDAPQFRGQLEFSMLDPRGLSLVAERRARLDAKYEKAREAFLNGDLAGAEQICQEIIKEDPSHPETVALLKQISERRNELKPSAPPP